MTKHLGSRDGARTGQGSALGPTEGDAARGEEANANVEVCRKLDKFPRLQNFSAGCL